MLPFAATPPAVIEAVLTARQEVRARTSVDERGPVAIDTETAPSATLQARSLSSRVWMTYAPRFTVRDIGIEPTTLTLHAGTVGLSKSFQRVTLTLREDASYGSQNFAGGALTTSTLTTLPVISRLPAVTSLDTFSLQTSLVASYAPSRRWTLVSYASYAASGGTTADSAAILPREYGPRAGLDARYAVTRRDGFLMGAAYALTGSSRGSRSTIASVSLGYSRAFSLRTTASLLAGVAIVRSRPDAVSANDTAPAPAASASITHRPLSGRTTGRYTATASLSPVVDRLTGRVALRADGSLNGTWPLTPRTSLQALAGVGRSFGDDRGPTPLPPITILAAEGSIGHSPFRWLRFDGGVRATYQYVDGVTSTGSTAVSPSQGTVFVAVTLTDTVRLAP